MYRLNATLYEPKANWTMGPLSCPQADDTIWTNTNGTRFHIECGWDRNGGSQKTVTATSYEACLNACASYPDCKSVSLNGKNCYLKAGTLGSPVRNNKVLGATLFTQQQ